MFHISATRLAWTLLMMLIFLSVPVVAGNTPLHPANTPPVAAFTIDPPSGGVVGTWYYFDPSSTHDNEDSLEWLQIRYDWENDGVYDTSWLNPANPSLRHRYDTPGTYTVRMLVKDNDDATDSVTHDIVVGDPGSNTAPVPRCVVTPASGPVGTTFTFSAATSTDAQDSTADLSARWAWYSGGGYDTDWQSATQDQTHQFNRHGIQEVELEVRDRGMLSDSVTCSVDVTPEQPNAPPTARLSITPTTGDFTTLFTLDPTASTDALDDISYLEVCYDWDNSGDCDTSWKNASSVYQRTFDGLGPKTIRIVIRDTGDLTDEASATITLSSLNPIFLPFAIKN